MTAVAPSHDVSKIPGAAAVSAQMGNANVNEADVPHIKHLKQLPQIYVSQRMDLLEMFTGFDVSNSYDVYLDEASKDAKARWLLAKEQSSFFQRLCCPVCREFDVFVGVPYHKEKTKSIMGELKELTEGTSAYVHPMLRVHRDFTFCCQEFDVYDHQNVHILNGKASWCNLYEFCPTKFTMTYGAGVPNAGEEFMTVNGPCQFWINLCRICPCRDPFVFAATGAGRNEGKGGLGGVDNIANGWCKQCFLNTDDYHVRFGDNADEIDRAAMVGLAVRQGGEQRFPSPCAVPPPLSLPPLS